MNKLHGLLVLCFFCACIIFSGCSFSNDVDNNNSSSASSVTLSSLIITERPDTTSYIVGESLDTTGMAVSAVYSDSSTKDVTESCSLSGFDSSSAVESESITVSYTKGGITKTALFTVSVLASGASKVSSINAVSSDTSYELGSSIDETAVTLTLTYSDDTTTVISGDTDGVIYSGFDSSSTGTQSVTIDYAGAATELDFKVYALDAITYAKYTKNANVSSQSSFGAVSCHDPKLFQDDDGTYYVYSTDASCGNVEYTGIVVRNSTDLMNWTCLSTSALQGYWDEDFLAWEGFSAKSTETKHSNSSYTAYTWAPTIIKQNGLYYMFHGTNNTCETVNGNTARSASSITMAVASSAAGPFYPAEYVSSYDADTEDDTNESDIVSIQTILNNLGITYSQSFLVRYTYSQSATSTYTASLDGNAIDDPDYSTCKNAAIYGAIDPEFVYDIATGELMTYDIGGNTCYAMTYGSWSLGIVLVYVDALSLKPVNYQTGAELDIPLDEQDDAGVNSGRNYYGIKIAGGYGAGYEGSQVLYNSDTGYYYLFVSMGDLQYEYRVGAGRASDITGTYYDAGGKSMFLQKSDSTADNYYSNYHAIGSKIIGAAAFDGEYSWRCPGGESILRTSDGKIMFACHTRTNFKAGYYFYLQCRQMFFTADDWPVLNQNEYYDDYDGNDEKLNAMTVSDIAGTYDAVLTVRGTGTSIPTVYGETVSSKYNTCDATPTASVSMTFGSDGTISGDTYGGTWTLGSDGYTLTITLTNTDGSTALGTFKGYVLKATDWAREGSVTRQTITFTTIDSTSGDAEAGEYLFGNKHNY